MRSDPILPGDAPAAQLPRDLDGVLALAARALQDVFVKASEGLLLVDRQARVVWINDAYRRYLPALGFASEDVFVGQAVADVVPNTQLHKVLETGQPILLDLLVNRAGAFVVSRIPLRDAEGRVLGALGIVLFDQPQTHLKPLVSRFAQLQRDLEDARRELAAQQRPGGERQSKYSFASFIGSSDAVTELKRQARRTAQSSSAVLLLGETGTGKELLAHAIHAASPRARGPLVSLNIAAIPEGLLEAEFFGVAPGAYTGAERRGRDGKFVLAHGGTLFLDEVGDMPLAVQAKLLRVLQEGEVEPLGSNRLVPVDVRIIAATSRDLPAMVRSGQFREDLFYRLSALPLRVPPLRERATDIPALVEVLAEDIALRSGLSIPHWTSDALDVLMAQRWRGNVRELRNVLEQLMLRADAGWVDVDAVRIVMAGLGEVLQEVPAPTPGAAPVQAAQTQPLDWRLSVHTARLEHELIHKALAHCGGNKVQAARLLGISRVKLYQRLADMGQGSGG